MRVSGCLIVAIGLATLLGAARVDAAPPKPIGTITFTDLPGLAGLSIVGITWAARNAPAVGGAGGGVAKTTFDPFRVVKLLDGTAPALYELVANGTSVTSVRIEVVPRRGTTLIYELEDVRVIGNERRSEGTLLLQELSLTAVRVRETITTAAGSTTSCFDTLTAAPCN